jgi:hypothetical protein
MKADSSESMPKSAPLYMTAEFFNVDGKRYKFEEIMMSTDLVIELVNSTGHMTKLRFWAHRQSERDYPIDKEAEQEHLVHSVAINNGQFVKMPDISGKPKHGFFTRFIGKLLGGD